MRLPCNAAARFLLAFSALAFMLTAHGEEEEESLFAKPYVLTEHQPDPQSYPLALENWDSCKVGRLMDAETRHLSFSLRNIAGKPVFIKAIKAGCPCIKLDKPLEKISLAPGQSVKTEFTISARKIKKGPFNRPVIVETEGAPIATVSVTGENVEMIDFSPAPAIDLGTFIGDVPWKRTVTIVSLLDDDSLKILPPPSHALLNVVLTKEAPKQFKVEISPKGTLPKKQNKVALLFPVEGIPNYDSVEIGLLFEPTGWKFQAENAKLTINKAETNLAEPCVVEGKLVLAKAPPKQPPKHYWGHKPPKDHLENNPNIAVVSVADNEENKAHPFSSPETWKPHLEKVVFPYLPENVKAEKIPSNGGIILKFTLPAGFFTEERTSLRVPVTYNGSPVATLSIVAQ